MCRRRRLIWPASLGLVAGENRLEVSFIDLTPGFYSAAPLFLLLGPPPVVSPTPWPTQTASATPQPTITPSATRTPTATSTRPAPVLTKVHAPPAQSRRDWPLSPLTLGGLLGGGGLAWLTWRTTRAGRPLPSGQVDLYAQDRFVDTIPLAMFGKSEVYLGSGGQDIIIPDPSVPEVAARIRAGQGLEPGMCWRCWTPTNPDQVTAQHLLQDGDYHDFGTFRLVYQVYQPEASFFEPEEGGLYV